MNRSGRLRRSVLWRGDPVGAVVADQRPQNVDAVPGEGEDGLGVLLALGTLAVVAPAEFLTDGSSDHGRVVEHPVVAEVVTPGAAQVAARNSAPSGRPDSGHAGNNSPATGLFNPRK
jgi:hypothetical protein